MQLLLNTPRAAWQRQAQSAHCSCQHSQPAQRPALLRHRQTTARRRRCLTMGAGAIQEMGAEELQVAIAERDRPLLIDFSAEWCGPCRLLTAELEAVDKELGDKIKIIKVDTDKNPELSSQLRIEGLPTMVFVGMQPDKPALRVEGLHAAKVIVEIFENEILTA